MPQFQIEVRPRSRSARDRTFVAYYQIEAATQKAAIAEATRKFLEQNPDKDITNCEFKVVRS